MIYTKGVQSLWHVLKIRDGQRSYTICGLSIRPKAETFLITDGKDVCTNCAERLNP